MTEIKYCEDCKFYKKKWFQRIEDAICMKFPDSHINGLVSKKSPKERAAYARLYESKCGIEAKGFEYKKR